MSPAISANGPKRRLRDICYSAAVRGKQTLSELPENDAHDPKPTCDPLCRWAGTPFIDNGSPVHLLTARYKL